MGGSQRKKERQRIKRQEKRVLQRRAAGGISPFRRIGLAGERATCYMNHDGYEKGLISLSVLRPVPGGGHALAVFLIDIWCLGLKDAFGRLEMTAQAFHDHIRRSKERGVELTPCSLPTARRLVAGAVRWSHDHGFRLPPRWERWAAVLGEIGDWRAADTSQFGKQGKLYYVGEIEDLRRRLIGFTVEEFFARSDVEAAAVGVSDQVGHDLSEVSPRLDEFLKRVSGLRDRVVSGTREWCAAQGIEPNPKLPQAFGLLALSFADASMQGRVDEAQRVEFGLDTLNQAIESVQESERAGLREALNQILAYMKTKGSFDELKAPTDPQPLPAIDQATGEPPPPPVGDGRPAVPDGA